MCRLCTHRPLAPTSLDGDFDRSKLAAISRITVINYFIRLQFYVFIILCNYYYVII